MGDPTVRLLGLADLDGAFALSSESGWNQRREDWGMLLRLAPAGAFAAFVDGRIVGTAIGLDYGGFGWIAMMIVEPAFRGRGLGGRLLEMAMSCLPGERPIRLDATPLGRRLYQRYGFVDEARLTRHVAPSGFGPVRRGNRAAVDAVSVSDLPALVRSDSAVMGGERGPLLEWVREQAPQYAYRLTSESGLMQYCLGRPGRRFDQIGPVVASDCEGATALVGAAAPAAGDRAIVVDSFDAHAGFGVWLNDNGFRAERPLYRMCRPGRRPAAVPTAIAEYAILGPEFA